MALGRWCVMKHPVDGAIGCKFCYWIVDGAELSLVLVSLKSLFCFDSRSFIVQTLIVLLRKVRNILKNTYLETLPA